MNTSICFIGGGNMASAMIAGLKQQQFSMGLITVIEPDQEKRDFLHNQYGVIATDQLPSAAQADVIVLAVKPQQLRDVSIFLSSLLHQQLIISIAAGIRSTDLARWLGGYNTIVRVMPNTPAQIQAGISGMFATQQVSAEQRTMAETIMKSAGHTVWVTQESDIDAVTAVSGSGPAYVFYFIEAMQDAAIRLGLNADQARLLTLQTFLGASQLAAASEESAATLRAKVTSKGGTTEQAILTMEHQNLKMTIEQAMESAAKRSKELGDILGND